MLDFQELRDFGGGRVPASAWHTLARQRTATVDEQVENGEVAQRKIGDHGFEPRHDLGMAPHGRRERPQAGEPTILKVALSA